MFFSAQSKTEQEKYENLLKILGSLSNLFSDSNVPYLYYRWAERVFCKSFNALDHSRWDTAIDAGKGDIWVGLKTFLDGNGKTFQKVAEFNRESANFRLISNPAELVMEIARLRNERLDFARGIHGVDSLIYHCVTRKAWAFFISEEKMDYIDIVNIKNIDTRANTIHFHDWIHQYNFSIAKSTLLKQFSLNPIYDFKVEILKDPFEYLEGVFGKIETEEIKREMLTPMDKKVLASVVLPLYSERWWKHVQERSGLNQWNAGWRDRKSREVYIPIPAWIHRAYPWFFPDRETPFELILPDGRSISASVCQDWSKALMSNPNTELGEWLIDDVLKLPEGKAVTYDILQKVWTDSVEVSKLGDNTFAINFKKIGSYDDFRAESIYDEE